jgi:hypothetical protein
LKIEHTLERVAAGSGLRSSSGSQGNSSPLVVRFEGHIEDQAIDKSQTNEK